MRYKQKNRELIILFTKQSTGTCMLDTRAIFFIGEHSSGWDDKEFTDFEREITLSN